MPTITHAGSTFNTTAGNKTVVATPAVGDLIVVVTACTGLSIGSTGCIDNNSSGTYDLVGTSRTGFSTTGLLQVWVRTSFITAASSTTFTAQQSGSTGGGLSVFRVAGMFRTGAGAVRSDGGQSSAAAGTPAPVLNQAALTANPVIAAVANGTSAATITPRSGYTEGTDLGYSTPTTGLETCFINSGETATTLTFGSSSATTFASIAIELDASAMPGPSVVAFEGAWADSTSPHDIVVTGCLTGDWLVRISGGDGGLSGGGNSVTASAFSTTVGSTGTWTDIEKQLPSGGGTGWLHLAAAQVTADGDVTVRATRTQAGTARAWGGVILRCRNSSGIGVHGFVNTSATETVSLTGISQDSVIGFISVDWDAGTPATGYTPSGATDVERAVESSNYTVHCAYWVAQASGSRSYGTNGTSSATNLVSAAVEVKAASSTTPIGKDLSLVWDTRAALGDSLQAIWDVRSAVSDALQAIWDVRANIGASIALSWDLRASLGDPLSLVWDVRATVSDDLSLLWDVASSITAIGKDLALIWDTRVALGDEVALVWDTRAALGDTLSLTWDVRSALGDEVSLAWDVRAPLGDDANLVWDVRSAIGDPLSIVWDVRVSLGDPLALIWDVRSPAGQSIQLIWDTQSTALLATKDLSLVWDTRAPLGDTLQAIWNIRSILGDDLAVAWDVRAAVSDMLALLWDVRSIVGDPLDLRWDVRAAAGDNLALIWHTRTTAGDELTLIWDTQSNVVAVIYHLRTGILLRWRTGISGKGNGVQKRWRTEVPERWRTAVKE